MSVFIAGVLILSGGFVGTILRWLAVRIETPFPWTLVLINIAASGAAAMANGLDGWQRSLATVGFLGALSTWSSLAYEVHTFWRNDKRDVALFLMLLTVGGSVMVAGLLL